MTGHVWLTSGLLDRDEAWLLKQLLTDCCLTEQQDGHKDDFPKLYAKKMTFWGYINKCFVSVMQWQVSVTLQFSPQLHFTQFLLFFFYNPQLIFFPNHSSNSIQSKAFYKEGFKGWFWLYVFLVIIKSCTNKDCLCCLNLIAYSSALFSTLYISYSITLGDNCHVFFHNVFSTKLADIKYHNTIVPSKVVTLVWEVCVCAQNKGFGGVF